MGGMGGLPMGMEGMNEEQLVQMMQQQPEMFAPLIEEIARQDPALLQEIQQNPAAFLGLLLQGMQNGEFVEGEDDDLMMDGIEGEGMEEDLEGDEEGIEGEEGVE